MRCANEIKIGDTIAWAAPVTITIDGVDQTDLSSWTVVCEFRADATNKLLSTADARLENGALLIEASTYNWRPGAVKMDVRFLLNGTVRTTRTAHLIAKYAVTELP